MLECLNAAKCGDSGAPSWICVALTWNRNFEGSSAALALGNLHILRTLSDLITTGIKRHCQFIPRIHPSICRITYCTSGILLFSVSHVLFFWIVWRSLIIRSVASGAETSSYHIYITFRTRVGRRGCWGGGSFGDLNANSHPTKSEPFNNYARRENEIILVKKPASLVSLSPQVFFPLTCFKSCFDIKQITSLVQTDLHDYFIK